MKPPLEEARKDLADIRLELEVMRRIRQDAMWLSLRDDVDGVFYQNIVFKVDAHIGNGSRVEYNILERYKELQ